MEQKTVSGKIPAELHAKFRSEMEARGWTMSFALEQVINEHFENEKGRNNTMENTRTLAFAVSEEFFQLVKEYLAWYEEVYHRRLTQKQFIIGLIEDELERNAEAMKERRNRLLPAQQTGNSATATDELEAGYAGEAAEDEAETEYGEEAAEDEAETEYGECALPGFVDSKNEEKTERNAGYLVVSHSGGGMLRQGTRKGIRRTPANRGMRAHWVVKGLDISEDVCHGMCP